MNNSGFVVIICWLFLQGEFFLVSGNKEIDLDQVALIVQQCDEYCSLTATPCPDHFSELKVATDANNEMKDKIHALEVTINSLRSQLLNSGTEIKNHFEQINDRNDQIKELRKQIKDKDEHNSELREQVKIMYGVLAEKNDQLSKINKTKVIEIKDRDDQIKELRKQIKDKVENIADLREQVKKMSGVLAEKNDQPSNINAKAETLSDRCPNGGTNSIFRIKLKGMEPFPVLCDSGWTVIQRRINGSVDFNRNWKDYKRGFGDMWGEFFIGLDKLHLITAAHPQELYIQLRDINGTERFARYDNFTVGSEEEGFNLKSLGEYWGNAGDSLREHETGKFATLDRDSKYVCVRAYNGPWWYTTLKNCGLSLLNGRYTKNGITKKDTGIRWGHWDDFKYEISLIFVQIQIRPRSPQS